MGENVVSPLGNGTAYRHGREGTAAGQGVQHSQTPCFTCRRRRVTCDRALPTCRKCDASGKQCSGYRKPLTWVRGIASRGKMMGLTFDDVAPKKPRTESGAVSRTGGVSGLGSSEERAGGVSPSRSAALVTRPSEQVWVRNQLPVIPALVDPVLQGLDQLERYYLSHFDQRFCRLMVLYEVPNQNPYRRLIPLVGASQTLSSAISAVGACHYMHMCNADATLSAPQHLITRRRSLSRGRDEFASSPNPAVRNVYQQFLMFKQRALSLLRADLADPSKRSDQTIIAAIVILLALDMVESGQGDWIVHVKGARDLIQSRLGQLTGPIDENIPVEFLNPFSDSFDTFLNGTLMTIDIMGSTLAKSGTWSEPMYAHLMTSPALLSISETMFVGCPAYILRIISYITSVRHSSGPASTNRPSSPAYDSMPPADLPSVLAYIDNFNPEGWAREMHMRMPFPPTDVSSPSPSPCGPLSPLDPPSPSTLSSPLYHLASAYKLCITLYATRVLLRFSSSPQPTPTPFCFPSHVSSILSHLTYLYHLPRSSEIFKSTLWLTFIAGAECRDLQEQQVILTLMKQLWDECLSVNIQAAARVLEAIWARAREESERELNWIQFLDSGNFSGLFI